MTGPPLPARRYLLTLPLAAAAFMGLAIVDERETFLAAWGLGGRATAPEAPTAGSAEAEQAVRAFNAALERCYAEGSTGPLDGLDLSAEVRQAVEAELQDPGAGAASRGLRLVRLDVVQVEPGGEDGYSLLTQETWRGPEPTPGRAASRLRFRYSLASSEGGFRIDTVTPVLPEPVDAAAR